MQLQRTREHRTHTCPQVQNGEATTQGTCQSGPANLWKGRPLCASICTTAYASVTLHQLLIAIGAPAKGRKVTPSCRTSDISRLFWPPFESRQGLHSIAAEKAGSSLYQLPVTQVVRIELEALPLCRLCARGDSACHSRFSCSNMKHR